MSSNGRARDDTELERLLAEDGGELGALYRRLPRPEPPRRLDRSVLGAAARAAHGYTPRRQRWLLGLGSAAGIVLAAGVAWHVGQDALRREQELAPPAAVAPAETARPTWVPVAPISEPARRAHDQAAASPAPAAPSVGTAAPPPAAKQAQALQKNEAKAKAAPKPQAARESFAPPPAAAPAPAVAPEPAPAQAFPADAERAEQSADSSVGGVAGGRAAKDARDAEVDSIARHRGTAAPSPSGSVELRRDLQLDPQTWLARIDELLRKGRRQQAIESLRLFHVAHPDYPLPDELRSLL